MRIGIPLILAATFLAFGCGSSSDEGTALPGSGVVTNPSGKPRNEQEKVVADQQQQLGNAMNADRAAAADAMKRAQAATGGK